jgi:glycosyltransferase involved in cell wall biosynthesis
VKVSLVGTVLNAADHVEEFLASLDAQTTRPDEVVIVDGGSTDGTADLLRRHGGIEVVEEPGANIARGRNVAIAAAAHDVLAVADVDCVLGPDWLRHLLLRIDEGADVAMGFTEAITDGLLQTCTAAVALPLDATEVDPGRFMPSSRSVAFRRDALEAVGGYPEWLAIGEDMWVNHRWRELGLDMRFAPEAVVRWRPRPTLGATWRQFFRYARGDAQAGMYPDRHALRFGVYAGGLLAARSRARLPKALAVAGALAYARTPLRRAWARLEDPAQRAAATAIVPALMAWIDSAKMAGYAAGLADRVRRT